MCVPYNPFYSAVEEPKFDDSHARHLYRAKRPLNSSDGEVIKRREELDKFSSNVEYILLTINENENNAAITFMEGPTENFTKAVYYRKPNIVVGMFAKRKTALIQSDVGDRSGSFIKEAIEFFPNAQYVIGVGVCYAFDSSKYKFGDVLVSKQICDLTNLKFKKRGKIEDRGQTIDVVDDLKAMFCMSMDSEFVVDKSNTRESRVYSGAIASYSALMDDKVMRDRFHRALPTTIGGEMEGGQLLQFERKRQIKGVIVIKGVVDYADGSKSKEWQFTAAMASLHYLQSKLLRVPSDCKYCS